MKNLSKCGFSAVSALTFGGFALKSMMCDGEMAQFFKKDTILQKAAAIKTKCTGIAIKISYGTARFPYLFVLW